MVPRSSTQPVDVKASNGKTYYLPPNTSVILNITSIHHNEKYWPNAGAFIPERFFGKSEKDEIRVDASLWLYVWFILCCRFLANFFYQAVCPWSSAVPGAKLLPCTSLGLWLRCYSLNGSGLCPRGLRMVIIRRTDFRLSHLVCQRICILTSREGKSRQSRRRTNT